MTRPTATLTPRELTAQVFAAVDSFDPAAFAAFFAPNGTVRFGNGGQMVGPEAITAGVGAFFATIKGLHHRVTHEWHDGPDTIVEADVTYDRLDGTSVTIPVVSIWQVTRDGSLDAYRVFFDVAPIYSH